MKTYEVRPLLKHMVYSKHLSGFQPGAFKNKHIFITPRSALATSYINDVFFEYNNFYERIKDPKYIGLVVYMLAASIQQKMAVANATDVPIGACGLVYYNDEVYIETGELDKIEFAHDDYLPAHLRPSREICVVVAELLEDYHISVLQSAANDMKTILLRIINDTTVQDQVVVIPTH